MIRETVPKSRDSAVEDPIVHEIDKNLQRVEAAAHNSQLRMMEAKKESQNPPSHSQKKSPSAVEATSDKPETLDLSDLTTPVKPAPGKDRSKTNSPRQVSDLSSFFPIL